MLELKTTIKCACGNKIKMVLLKRNELTNPYGIIIEDPKDASFGKIVITNGELKLVDGTDSILTYNFICDECLEKEN